MIRRPPRSTLFPTRRSSDLPARSSIPEPYAVFCRIVGIKDPAVDQQAVAADVLDSAVESLKSESVEVLFGDRKSTRLNSSHSQISYAVFCLKKKKKKNT